MINKESFHELTIIANERIKEKQYWLDKLSGNLVKTSFPYDFNKREGYREEEKNHPKKTFSFEIPGETFEKLVWTSNNSDIGIFMILVTDLKLLLHKYTGHEDIIVGAPVEKQELEGALLNTILPLRTRLEKPMTFKDLLIGVKQIIIEATEHQNYPLETIPLYPDMETRERDGFPLFDIGILLDNIHDKSYIRHINLDMILSFLRTGEGIPGEVEYNPLLYRENTVQRMVNHFIYLLQQALKDVNAPLTHLEIMPEAERNHLLFKINDTGTEYPQFVTIHELVEAQVKKTPGKIAVEEADTGRQLSYKELNQQANQLSHRLRKKGLKPSYVAALMGERTLEIVTGILAILKTGGVLLPLDEQNPDGRIHFILEDSTTCLFLSQEHLIRERRGIFQSFPPAKIIALDDETLYRGNSKNPGIDIGCKDLAYIIYTSGTTGKPKGVMVEHRSLVNYIYFAKNSYVKSEPLDFPLCTSIAFDLTITSVFTPLVTGNAVVVYNDWNRGNLIEQIVDENKVGVLKLTPSHLHLLADKKIAPPCSIKRLIVGGEILESQLARDINKNFNGDIEIYNEYGPTETTVGCMLYKFDPLKDTGSSVPIGQPAANTRIYLLDKNLKPVPIGAPGEIYVSGNVLARGYLNRPELTAEKFIKAIITLPGKLPKTANHRLYRTGDLARWLPDDNIEFLGRIDGQVKIRGNRIELGEIQQQLVKHPQIKEAAVIVKTPGQDPGKPGVKDQYLCAYIVSPGIKEGSQLKEYLSNVFPDYMIPSYFVLLDRMPLTPNGKLDRKALPEPEIEKTKEKPTPPGNYTEKILARIWAEVLKIKEEDIDIHANFFQLGGHSLNILIMAAKIHKEFETSIPLMEIFDNPTIEKLAKKISASKTVKYESIKCVEKKEYYALSSAQQRLFFLHQLDPHSLGYNIPNYLIWEEDICLERVKEVFHRLIQRHESLRTSFHMVKGLPVQRIHQNHEVTFNIEYNEIKKTDTGNRELTSRIRDFMQPFDLSRAPLMRMGVIKPEPGKHIILFDMHHIISDATSQKILNREFIDLYMKEQCPRLHLQYKDYGEWQNSRKQSDTLKPQEEYWLNQFKDEIPALNLPIDYPRPLIQGFAGDNVCFFIEKQDTMNLKTLALQEDVTLYMILLAIFYIMISKVSRQEDIVIGIPIEGRPHDDLRDIIGMFVNTLPLRNFPGGEKTFCDFLKELRENTLKAFENQEYQFEDLVERLGVIRDTSRNPIFSILFQLENLDVKTWSENSQRLKVSSYPIRGNTSKFDLSLEGLEAGEILNFNITYCTRLFKRETIERLIGYFKWIISVVLDDTREKIGEIEIISAEERQQILVEFNNTCSAYPHHKTIIELFEHQVQKTPDHVALVGPKDEAGKQGSRETKNKDDISVTYQDLNKKSLQLACFLREKGVQTDTAAAIMIERSPEMIIGIFGILKSGGAYLPIAPDYPQERIDYMLKDSSAKILLTANEIASLSTECTFTPGAFLNPSEGRYFTNDQCPMTNDQLAYILYTSGSTGKPKGVMVQHHSLVNRLNWMQKVYPLGQGDIILQKTTFTFDVSIWELFWWSFTGANLCLLGPGQEGDPEAIVNAIASHHVTTIHFVPSMFKVFLSYLENSIDPGEEGADFLHRLAGLRRVFTSGEALLPDHGQRFNRLLNQTNGTRLINLYGPTEATIDVSYFNCPAGELPTAIPIGKPIDNINLYIVDEYMNLQPPGIPGELCITGVGLARGYLNNPGLTAEKFVIGYLSLVTKKFKKDVDSQWSLVNDRSNKLSTNDRIYRTGDLARWLTDGNIEFLGRLDQQVKIRGFRIELGEIESQLLKHIDIKDSAVLLKENTAGEPYLCAYIVTEQSLNSDQLQKYLRQYLPEYSVPARFIKVSHIPLTPSGKLAGNMLPGPGSAGSIGTAIPYTTPRDSVERKLTIMWAELLGMAPQDIGIDYNFFSLGGHSLKATVLLADIHKELNLKIPLVQIFKTPTIRGLAEIIKKSLFDEFVSIKPVEKREYYRLSPAQRRLYFLQEMNPGSISYQMPFIYPLGKNFEIHKLETIFKKMIARHESLRTSIIIVDEVPVQRIHQVDDLRFSLDYYEAPEIESQEIARNYHRPFDFSQAPLIRSAVIKLPGGHLNWLINIHHIISDGTSLTILTEDFFSLYKGETLKPLQLGYKDFAQWQNQWFNSDRVKDQEAYWMELFPDAGEIPRLELPADYQRPGIFTFTGDRYGFMLDREDAIKFNTLGSRQGGTLYMNVLTALNTLFYKYTGQQDIIIGCVTAGRSHIDLQPIVGMFVNTLAIRNYPGGEKTYEDFLHEVISNSVKAFENQDVQFDVLVDKLAVKRDPSRNPLFDISMGVQNFRRPGKTKDASRENMQQAQPERLPASDENLPSIKYDNLTSKFDATFFVNERGEDIYIEIEYYTGIFEAETVKRMGTHLTNIIKAVIKAPSIKLNQIDMISPGERRRVLYEFNDTADEYPRDKVIHRLIEDQAARTPDHAALIYHDQTITYRVLDQRAGRTACFLYEEKGIAPRDEAPVGILMSHPLYLADALLGISKVGAVYVPIDPSITGDRLKYMIHDAGIGVVVSEKKFTGILDRLQAEGESCFTYVCVDSMDIPEGTAGGNIRDVGNKKLSYPVLSNQLAYIIYTSGTTGQPKGVEVEHRGAVNTLWYRKLVYGMQPRDVSLQLFSYVFDGFVTSFFTPLVCGAVSVCVAREETADIDTIRKTINRNGVTHFICVPPLYAVIIESLTEKELSTLKVVTLAGDKISGHLLAATSTKSDRLEIVNEYGVTEASVLSTLYRHQERDQRIKIGHPIANTGIYILDEQLKLQPIGVLGELCIAGEGLARGYLNNPELTREKFVIRTPLPHSPIYRSGDLARWLSDGNIEYIGRRDHQVKIRGFRIELPEIEGQLLKHDNVKEAVVIASGENEPHLIAYIVPLSSPSPSLSAVELRIFLSGDLPDYMIPAHFIQIEQIPVTASGKVNREALKSQGTKLATGVKYLAPESEMEKIIAAVWKEVLQQDTVGTNDNFFDLGGNSLSILQVDSKLSRQLAISIPVTILFQYTTIASLAGYLSGLKNPGAVSDQEKDMEYFNRVKDSLHETLEIFTRV